MKNTKYEYRVETPAGNILIMTPDKLYSLNKAVKRTLRIISYLRVKQEDPKTEIIKFQVGQTYQTRSVCDSDCIFTLEVISRTAKFLTLKQYGKTFRRGIYVYSNTERCQFSGAHSMAPSISADRKKA